MMAGCSKKPAGAASVASADPAASNLVADPSAAVAPDKNQQSCFHCEGLGHQPCHAPGCAGGQVECPGPCLKLTRGKWEHMVVAGHGPNELWQKYADGPGKTIAWNQNHVGEVIVMRNGAAVNTGKCTVCGGTTKAKCPACQGLGQQACDLCEGKKIIPVSWTANDNPWLNRQPDLIRLKDGRALLGRVDKRTGTQYTIKTRDGQMVELESADILPKAAPAK